MERNREKEKRIMKILKLEKTKLQQKCPRELASFPGSRLIECVGERRARFHMYVYGEVWVNCVLVSTYYVERANRICSPP